MRELLVRQSLQVVLIALVVGCGPPPVELEKTVPASGVLTYKGRPLQHHTVVFFPDDQRRPAMGRADAEGKFTMGTNKPGDGAPPGKHKITVFYVSPEANVITAPGTTAPSTPPKVVSPSKYADAETTNLTIEIPATGATDLKIDLK